MISRARLLLLSVLFFFICLGLGYPSLNRVDWRTYAGLSDVKIYGAMETHTQPPDINQHLRFRVLVPYLARPFYLISRGHIGTWDPVTFGLLIVDSAFTAGTAILLILLAYRILGSYSIALGSALIYLLNFAVPNLRLVGLVDAGEGFFLMLVVWALFEERYWLLPICGALGAATKESFVPFVIVFTASWWICSRKHETWKPTADYRVGDMIASISVSRPAVAWIVLSWFTTLASVALVQWRVRGTFKSPVRFGVEMHGNTAYLHHFLATLGDRNLWYVFLWLLPLGLIKIKKFPRNWLVATAMSGLTVFALDTYFGADPGSVGRAMFSVAGPLLSASVAVLLFTRGTNELSLIAPNGEV